MKEIQDIVRAFDEAQKQNKQTALATVVHVEGSAYRRPGARMLVTEDGQLTGAISGGCLEGDALRKARLAMAQQKPMLVTYDTTDDDDAKLGVGLGCNGIIHILIEPIKTDKPYHPILLLKSILKQRQKAVIVTVFNLQNRAANQCGTCLFLAENDTVFNFCSGEFFTDQILNDAHEILQKGNSELKRYHTSEGVITAFIEHLKPVVSLVICGAGNDVQPLVKMASVLGWQISIADGRSNYGTTERFPQAQKILVTKPVNLLPKLEIDEQTVFLLMTHNYNYDIAILRQLLPLDLPYIGVLGPKKKLERMLEELEETGTEIIETQLSKIFGPTGLDIGAETPEEIALSILAEIKTVLAGKNATFLREKTEPIHEVKVIEKAFEIL